MGGGARRREGPARAVRRLGRRLGRLEAARGAAPRSAPRFDRSALSAEELLLLDDLAARCRPGEGPYPASDPHGLWALTDEELDALERLAARFDPAFAERAGA